jgi:hypothetical protein
MFGKRKSEDDAETVEYPMFDEDTEALEVGFKDNFVISLKRIATFRSVLGILISIGLMVLLVYAVRFIENMVAQSGNNISVPLLSLLMLSVPLWTITTAGRTSMEKRRKLNASGTAGILGRYVGAVIGTAIQMAIVYAVIFALLYYFKSDVQFSLVYSIIVMVGFVAVACALTMFFNTMVTHATGMTVVVLFILVPVIAFVLGPFMGIVEIDALTSAMPLVDSISSTATGGFGGATVLSALSVVKSSPAIEVSLFGTLVVCIGWAILFLGLTIWKQYRRESQ